jgi:putative ABC transport system permease protein
MPLERSRGLYRLLLRLGPRRLRDRHARDMELLFAERLDEASQRGSMAALAVWISATWDLVRETGRDLKRKSVTQRHGERRPSMLGTDLKYTLRWLARQKASSALVAVMLALGIGANIVVFSLVNALFLRPFPFPEPERLVYINETAPKWNLEIVGVNYPDFDQWAKSVQMFAAIGLYDQTALNLSDGNQAERISGAQVTAGFAKVLGIEPLLGRMFTAEEDRPKAPGVTVIGEALWRERFGGSADALGRVLKLNGVPHTIVGVMPRAAEFPGEVRLWVPMAGDPNQKGLSYGAEGLGRLKRGVTAEDATKDLLRAQEPIWNARDKDHIVSPFARPLHAMFVRNFWSAAATLLSAVALLLIVTCANVASIMLARALARRREMSIRLAIGASRIRIARQLLLENLILAAVGGLSGLAAGRWALHLLVTSAGDQIPPWASFDFDARIAAFAVGISLVTALLFGLAPALHAIRGSVRGAMIESGTGTTAGPGGRRTLSWLVGAEFTLAAVLIICGGLLMRAYDRVRHVDPGFDPGNVLTFGVSLPRATYSSDEKALAFWDRLSERLPTLPGVEAAGLVSCAPLGCHWGTFWDIEGRAPLAPGESNPVTLYRPASPPYFRAMGVRLKTGRFFTREDGRNGSRAVIVNETFVKTFWPGVADPVGRRIRAPSEKAEWMTVVGMTEDVRHYGLEQPMRPGIYVPLAQQTANDLTVVIKTKTNADAFSATARAALRELDPELPLFRVRTMEEALERSLSQRALYSWLLGVFASLALLLALGGAYGVTSYLVSQRTREIGIRLALGARNADITRHVLRGSLTVAGIGIAAGLAASMGAARLLATLLFGVSPHDTAVLSAAIVILLGTAAVANLLPARRAARVDPMKSLRVE